MTNIEKPMPGSEPDPVTAQRKTSTADLIDAVNGLNSHIKKLRVWIYCTILALTCVAVVCIIIGIGYNRLDTAYTNSKTALDSQECINKQNDQRNIVARDFLIQEYQKVNNQYIGIKRLRDAGLAGDHEGQVSGFNEFLKATKAYRDSKTLAGRLKDYGVEIHRHKDGTVTLTAPDDLPTTAC